MASKSSPMFSRAAVSIWLSCASNSSASRLNSWVAAWVSAYSASSDCGWPASMAWHRPQDLPAFPHQRRRETSVALHRGEEIVLLQLRVGEAHERCLRLDVAPRICRRDFIGRDVAGPAPPRFRPSVTNRRR